RGHAPRAIACPRSPRFEKDDRTISYKEIGRAPSAPRPLHFPLRRIRRAVTDAPLSTRCYRRGVIDAPLYRSLHSSRAPHPTPGPAYSSSAIAALSSASFHAAVGGASPPPSA